MDWINFRHLYAFWMVWKCGGFRRASERMRVAQSAISDQVGQLEDYLGKQLLIRSRRKIELTKDGKILSEYAEEIFFKAQEIHRVIRDDAISSFFPASINIGIVGGISRNFVSRFISSVQSRYANTYCKVVTGAASDLFVQLENHDLHLVFSIELPSKERVESLAFRKLLQSSICLAGRKAIIRSIRSKKPPPKLPFYEFVYTYPEEVSLALERQLDFKPQVSARSDDIPLLRFLANSRNGLALLPEVGVMDDTERDQVDIITIPDLGVVNINGYFARSGPYREVAENVLEVIQDFTH